MFVRACIIVVARCCAPVVRACAVRALVFVFVSVSVFVSVFMFASSSFRVTHMKSMPACAIAAQHWWTPEIAAVLVGTVQDPRVACITGVLHAETFVVPGCIIKVAVGFTVPFLESGAVSTGGSFPTSISELR